LAAAFDEGAMKKKLEGADVRIELSIGGDGEGGATFWTCDLTEGYIEINGSYRT
jgi:glutamate N-acetyltransferase/amino-acid N-acetyltransferase